MTTIPKKLITHDGSFHTDDIFTCATLVLMLEKDNEKFEIIRTREKEVIDKGDFVFDVGGVYDENANRFDHHQNGGAGKRSNGIEYASFGLVWKKFGTKLCRDERTVDLIDKKLACPIDAWDNGFDLVQNKYEVTPFYLQHVFSAMSPTWKEENLTDDMMFLKAVDLAKEILSREIIQIQDALLAEEIVISIYEKSSDKRIIVLDKSYPYEYALHNFPEPIFVIYQRDSDNLWAVRAVKQDPKAFSNRKDLPKSWAGLRDEELQKVTGVSDAIFCHRALFLVVAKSKEGAMKLAQIALES